MSPGETERRQAILLHIVLTASIAVYAALLGVLAAGGLRLPPRSPTGSPGSFWALAAIGLAQFAGVWWLGWRRLGRGTAGNQAPARVRTFFLVRAAAAEALGVFGLLAGILEAPPAETIALFVLSLAAMFAGAPTRPAWDAAMRRAEGR